MAGVKSVFKINAHFWSWDGYSSGQNIKKHTYYMKIHYLSKNEVVQINLHTEERRKQKSSTVSV